MSEIEEQKKLLLKQMLKMHYAFQASLEATIKKIEVLAQLSEMDKAQLKHEALSQN